MAGVVAIGEPVNDAERLAIAHLRDHLPNTYTIFHNFEILRDGETFEVDVAVLAPHALYLVDVKGTRGLIDVYGPKWYPEGRQPFSSPLAKLRGHARTVKGLIAASQPGRGGLDRVYVDAVVLLTAPDAHLVDPGGRDITDVTTLSRAATFFQSASRIPPRFDRSIVASHRMVQSALVGAAKPRKGPLLLGEWEVLERLGATDTYVEYRGFNALAGKRGGTALLRAYKADPYLPADERKRQRARIANAFTALNRLPGHPRVAGARSFFPTEGEERYVLVTEDVAGQPLRLHIDKPALALTLDQKLRVAREILEGLAFCHQHGVVHRNVTPATILIGTDGHVRLTAFDHARVGIERSVTIAREIVDEVDPAYVAPEAYREPEAASAASDVFSAGLVLYELLAGERAFGSPTELFEQSGVFSVRPSARRAELSSALDAWVQRLCAFHPDHRPTAADALGQLETVLAPRSDAAAAPAPAPTVAPPPPSSAPEPLDYRDLPRGTVLAGKLEVERRLGAGAFGVVYKVVDTLGDVARALKLILRDRHSPLERLKKEYRTLLRLPEHPHVVRVIDANFLPGDGPPYILFEYVQGEDVGDLLADRRFAPEDALTLLRQAALGLAHLHREGVYHCDIKPHNILWTVNGVKIIDFNVSVRSEDNGHGGGSRRYLPPDLDLGEMPTSSELVDRDLYALGLTAYEALTGRYPWEASTPPPAQAAPDPRSWSGFADLAPELVALVMKAIAPRRAERFASASELLTALEGITAARRENATESSDGLLSPALAGPAAPNTNPFVSHLLTLYSQSARTNAGTRGLDELGRETYVSTLLDDRLLPDVLGGAFKLVVITGNAGDGKTAFLQQLEAEAGEQSELLSSEPLPNGRRFSTRTRSFLTNYDGSQDEGDQANDAVLRAFFAPFEGERPEAWPDGETRLIAVNEGRLVDFLTKEERRFPALLRLVEEGLRTGADAAGVAVVNLNLRSVVVSHSDEDSILERLVRRLTAPKFWAACQSCDLKERCYALHNARTFQDRVAGPRALERLKTLYTLTHLRGRLHVTMRDVRSALAFTLTSARDCGEIHALYANGRREEIAHGFYFNAWMGGGGETADRLLTLLKDVDVGAAPDPGLDRGLDFVSPARDQSRFSFGDRGTYDDDVLRALFDNLPRDFSGKPTAHRAKAHRAYVAMARRRAFFERRDTGWRAMLPFRSAERMLALVRGESDVALALPKLLEAINRGEGLADPSVLQGTLALQVREVERGTIRSYRLFPAERFSLSVRDGASRARFVENMPDALVLKYAGGAGAELVVTLDVFEMLQRLNQGYRASVEEVQGYYLALAVFKNVLGSAPYQEVLLTTTGHDFYRIRRHPDGRLELDHLRQEAR